MAGPAHPRHDTLRFPLFSYQPLRSLFRLGRKAWILAHVPFWLAYLAVFRRPHPEWPISTTLISWLGKEEGETFARIGLTEELSLDPGDDDFEVISPGPLGLYVGPLQQHPSVHPVPIGLTRYHYQEPLATQAPLTRPEDDDAAIVVLHLHGGAFVWGSGRAKQMAFLADTLLTECRGAVSTIYAPQYRLSSYGVGNNNPFPAALQDAVTAYYHLVVTLGIPPARIVVAGDSAGGGLAVALVRYLEAFGPGVDALSLPLPLQRPLAAVLVSPWLAPCLFLGPLAAARAAFAQNPHSATDWMPFWICRWGARVYTASALVPDEDNEPYVTALGHPFATRTPLLAALGAAEILEVEGTAWARDMRAVPGNRVDVMYEDAAPHDTLLLGRGTPWEESARGVARGIGGWLREIDSSRATVAKKV